MHRCAPLLLVVILPLLGLGQAEEEETPAADVKVVDLEWLAGHWSGQALGGFSEETWSEPRGGTMIGMFRLNKDGRTFVIEFVTIEDTAAGVIYRFKHFHADFRTWEEEPLTYHLVESDEGFARFESRQRISGKPRQITYESLEGNRLQIMVEGWDSDSVSPPMELSLARAVLGGHS